MIIDAGPIGFKLKVATSGLHKVCFANASGMIIPAQVFSDVGLMREDLFIDCVDTEWCTRAEHLGYSIYCNADMVITHSLGDRSINVLGRVITQHSPLRHYYLARNSMYLALYSKHLTLNKRLFFLLRAIKRVVGHAVLSAPRLENLRMGVLGIWHGVIGRLGKHG
jgi:rhamnosyltransferase